MEALLVIIFPIVFLWIGFLFFLGRPITPGALIPVVYRQLSRAIRWLWKERPQKGGAGRPRKPPSRYRR